MLVLSRKVGESIMIGHNIRVVVTQMANGRVGLGIEAPKEVSVNRPEAKKHYPAPVVVPVSAEAVFPIS